MGGETKEESEGVASDDDANPRDLRRRKIGYSFNGGKFTQWCAR